MHKIEQQMLDAIRDCRNWKSGNTQVTRRDPCASVYLHGNHIAEWVFSENPVLNVNLDTFRRWPTRTTVSRLRALGIDASIKGGRPHLNGELI